MYTKIESLKPHRRTDNHMLLQITLTRHINSKLFELFEARASEREREKQASMIAIFLHSTMHSVCWIAHNLFIQLKSNERAKKTHKNGNGKRELDRRKRSRRFNLHISREK